MINLDVYAARLKHFVKVWVALQERVSNFEVKMIHLKQNYD